MYDEDKDLNGKFINDYYIFPDEDDTEYVSEKIITTHGEKEVYPIGAYSWTWTEVQ